MAVKVVRLDEPGTDLPFRLGRHVEHDDRSRRFDASALARRDIRPMRWRRESGMLDQGAVGACTGFAMAGLLGCAPWCGDPVMFGPNEGMWLYALATRVDAFPGWWPDEDTGSSGVGVARAARDLNMIRGWATAFTTEDMLNALMHGPVLWGIPWFESMFYPRPDGAVDVEGQIVGGHEIVCRGWDGERFLLDNSWSADWGPLGGSFYVYRDAWETKLRPNDADVVVPIL